MCLTFDRFPSFHRTLMQRKNTVVLLHNKIIFPLWRHRMGVLSASLFGCPRNHRSPVDSPHKGTVARTFCVPLLIVWRDCGTHTRLAGNSRRHDGHLTSSQCKKHSRKTLYSLPVRASFGMSLVSRWVRSLVHSLHLSLSRYMRYRVIIDGVIRGPAWSLKTGSDVDR